MFENKSSSQETTSLRHSNKSRRAFDDSTGQNAAFRSIFVNFYRSGMGLTMDGMMDVGNIE